MIREKKSFEGFGERGRIDGRWAAKVRQQQLSQTLEINLTFHPELPSFLFCTPSHILAVLTWLCKVCLLKRRYALLRKQRQAEGLFVMTGKREKMVGKIVRPLKRCRTKKVSDFSVSIPLHSGHFRITPPMICCRQTWKVSNYCHSFTQTSGWNQMTSLIFADLLILRAVQIRDWPRRKTASVVLRKRPETYKHMLLFNWWSCLVAVGIMTVVCQEKRWK